MTNGSFTTAQVLRKFSQGPDSGVFTDGGSSPNPGPGGWGVVHVQRGEIVVQRHGHDPDTTNNRMELTALIQAFKLIPSDQAIDIYSDSNLCVQTINQWAAGWEKSGWKRKSGPIANLDLVQELWSLAQQRPKAKLQWVKAHNGWLWNEYADSLANAWNRSEV